jgi:sulfate adenylyltransferase subunit 2
MDHIRILEGRSIELIRDAHYHLRGRLAVLWSMGKDSTALLWMIRKSFLGRVPMPVVHIDTGYKFPAMYAYREKIATEWGLDLRITGNTKDMRLGMGPEQGRLVCCHSLKTEPLAAAIEDLDLGGVLVAIRRDEHGVRAKERYVSSRDAEGRWSLGDRPPELWSERSFIPDTPGGHVRIHALLDWTELDVWEYLDREGVPVNELYFARDGQRYRSLGCVPCTAPVASQATDVKEIIAELRQRGGDEREGRSQDKEHADAMQRLRALGYM